ncbi:Lysosomal acid phosphatase [Dufourea novaeangliae]|uniref:Lysosomal acid phosphatase n=2 Tax=Dufourea novaeangliae TaxID=178035 RepID=A0A154P3B1_DUFNO|nr:Lysosomal acid phosphatase [Dufourea novaeangliae]
MGVQATVVILGIGIGSIMFAYVAFAASTDANDKNASVRLTIFVFRHGDRTPTETYPKDPYGDYEWEGGLGALTKKGMLRMYNVGQWIREKYGSLIGRKYESRLTLVQSSYADRCLMSAQALLAGLYPPLPDEIFVPGLNWRPIPVHSTPRNLDKTIVVKVPCPRLEEALKEAYTNESMRLGTPSAKYYEELSYYTGQNLSTITDIEFLYNTLEIEEQSGLNLPEWTKKYYNREMRDIAARSLAIFTSNTLQQRLRGGPLLKEILGRMRGAAADRDNASRAYLYSVHDITLVNLLRTMGFTDEYFKPNYGATLIFQMDFSPDIADTEHAEIKLMFLNDTDKFTVYPLEIPKCGTFCLLEDAANLWKNVLPDYWDAECTL